MPAYLRLTPLILQTNKAEPVASGSALDIPVDPGKVMSDC